MPCLVGKTNYRNEFSDGGLWLNCEGSTTKKRAATYLVTCVDEGGVGALRR